MRLNALSLFSSAGIAETYFAAHGVDVKVAAELLPERAKIYKHLYPNVDMLVGDITEEGQFNIIIDKAKKAGCELIIATPPCQGMSTAGKQKKDDPRNKLIVPVVEAIKVLKPNFVIIENVPEILNTQIKVDEEWILIDQYLKKELEDEYAFNSNKIVNAMNYGVAQSRERCIYLLSKKELDIKWEFPKHFDNIVTMRDVIGDLPSLDPNVTDITEEERDKLFPEYEAKKQAGLKVSKWHYPPNHKLRHVLAMMHTPEGHSAWENNLFYPKLADGTKGKGYKNTYKRQWWDKPAYTVTRYTSRLGSQENGHPGRIIVKSENETERVWSDCRVLTIFELMRISSLPDDWKIPENTSTNIIREIIGEGVPPRLIEQALISLEEIYPPKNKIKGVSLFANVGVAETYFKDCGVEIVVANELIEQRVKFYKHLYPSVDIVQGDITQSDVFDKVINKAKDAKVDFLIATPPCQGMSCAGSKNPDDPRNFLIYYAVEAIKKIRPKYVIIENVPMQRHTKIEYGGTKVKIPEYVESELGAFYNFNHNRIVNAMDYGVPQSRQRYIYLLTDKNLNLQWEFPVACKNVITMEEAIGHLPSLDPYLRESAERWRFPEYEQKKKAGLEVSKWHYPPTHSWKQVEWMIHTPSGKSAFSNEYFFPKKDGRRIKGAPRTYMRMSWDKPATTIMQNSQVISTFSTVHPGRPIVESNDECTRIYSDARVLSIYELLILSSLPADWNIPEWAGEALIRKVIGEGIPPLLLKHILMSLLKEIEKC